MALMGCVLTPPVATRQTPGAAAPAAQDAQIQEGGRLAKTLCASCHTLGPSGASPNPLAAPLRLLAQKYPAGDLGAVFTDAFAARHPVMPSFRLTAPQMQALLAYLRTIQAPAEG